MFFTHELLVGPTGKFALLWRAAVKKEKIKKRQLESMDVSEICKSLIKYIRPRSDSRMSHITGFSLRLSAQLVHGVIVCYNWKVAYVLDDALSSWKAVVTKQYLIQELSLPMPKKKRSKKSGKTVEDNYLLDINFNADPMFGEIMSVDMELPALLPPHTTTDETTSSSGSEAKKKRSRVDRHVADLSHITMQEGISVAMEGTDLLAQGEAAQFDLNDLNAFGSTSMFDGAPIATKEPTAIISRSANATPAAAVLLETPTLPKTPRRRRPQEPVDESVLAVPLQEDVRGPTVTNALDQAGETGQVEPSPLVLDPLSQFQLVPTRSRRRRRLIIDPKIELKSDEMKKQLKIKPRTIQQYRDEGLLDEPVNFIPVNVLFSNATLHCSAFDTSRIEQERADVYEEPNIRNLFNSSIADISQGMDIGRISGLQEQTGIEERVIDESSIQVVRDVSAISGVAPPDLSIPTEGEPSFLQTSRPSGRKHRVSTIPQRDISELAPPSEIEEPRLHLPFQDVPPEPSHIEDMEFGQADEQLMVSGAEEDREARVLSDVRKLHDREQVVTFSKLAPPGLTGRSDAARQFYGLLACAKSRSLRLRQQVGFGEIVIY